MNEDEKRRYQYACELIKSRLIAAREKLDKPTSFYDLEAAALHIRKIIEATAYLCLSSATFSMAQLPKSLKGKWDPEAILLELGKKNALKFPDRVRILETRRIPESGNNAHHLEIMRKGENAISEFKSSYRYTHRILHEINPQHYQPFKKDEYTQFHNDVLLSLRGIHMFLWSHLWVHRVSHEDITIIANLGDTANTSVKVITTTVQ